MFPTCVARLFHHQEAWVAKAENTELCSASSLGMQAIEINRINHGIKDVPFFHKDKVNDAMLASARSILILTLTVTHHKGTVISEPL